MSSMSAASPLDDVLGRPRRDDPIDGHAEPGGALTAVGLHVELPGSVSVRVDREEAPSLKGKGDELVRGVAPGGAATCSAVVNSVSYGPVPAR